MAVLGEGEGGRGHEESMVLDVPLPRTVPSKLRKGEGIIVMMGGGSEL